MTTIGTLDSYFTNIISNILEVESQPVGRYQTQVDEIKVQRGVYNDLKTQLTSLQSQVTSLISSNAFYSLNQAYKTSVSTSDGKTVLNASASSSAIAGTYSLENIVLAKEHRVRSDQQVYTNQALNLSGTFIIGGAADRSQTTTATVANTVGAFSVADPDSEQQELGTDSYYVEVRNDAENGWQFRMVNSDGTAVRLKKSGTTETYTSNWQSIPSGGGTFDTGRGIQIDFGADSGLYQEASRTTGNAASFDYVAKAASIDVEATDSLNDIASAINKAKYGAGSEVSATIVDNQLVLAAANTGLKHAVVATDQTGTVLQSLGILDGVGDFKNQLQPASNSSFDINGISVIRSSNTGIDDVITGVTLNLAPDAQGQNATLTVDENTTPATTAVQGYLDAFNKTITYLTSKTAITSYSSGGETTYSRGALSGDYIFTDLRSQMLNKMISNHSNAGVYQNLRKIGIVVNDNLQVTIEDTDAFKTALENNPDDVTMLFDSIMTEMDTTLSRFTGTEGYLSNAMDSFDNQSTQLNTRITDMNKRLSEREKALILQYSEMQSQLYYIQYTQNQLASLTSMTNTLTASA